MTDNDFEGRIAVEHAVGDDAEKVERHTVGEAERWANQVLALRIQLSKALTNGRCWMNVNWYVQLDLTQRRNSSPAWTGSCIDNAAKAPSLSRWSLIFS